jgi:hypothetical protein
MTLPNTLLGLAPGPFAFYNLGKCATAHHPHARGGNSPGVFGGEIELWFFAVTEAPDLSPARSLFAAAKSFCAGLR